MQLVVAFDVVCQLNLEISTGSVVEVDPFYCAGVEGGARAAIPPVVGDVDGELLERFCPFGVNGGSNLSLYWIGSCWFLDGCLIGLLAGRYVIVSTFDTVSWWLTRRKRRPQTM